MHPISDNEAGSVRKPRILIVDDAATVRRYHRTILEAADIEAHEAVNGVEALERALVMDFDLFLVDVNMPEMNGYRFLQEVRRTPTLEAIPAIMISTESKRVDMDQAFASGANLYMVKPIRPDAFSEILKLLFARAA